jgi:hypothetical protein
MNIYQIHHAKTNKSYSNDPIKEIIVTETEIIAGPTTKKQEFWGKMHIYYVKNDDHLRTSSYYSLRDLRIANAAKHTESLITHNTSDVLLLETRLFRIGTPEQVKWFKRCYPSPKMKPTTFSKYIKLRTKSVIHHEPDIWSM